MGEVRFIELGRGDVELATWVEHGKAYLRFRKLEEPQEIGVLERKENPKSQRLLDGDVVITSTCLESIEALEDTVAMAYKLFDAQLPEAGEMEDWWEMEGKWKYHARHARPVTVSAATWEAIQDKVHQAMLARSAEGGRHCCEWRKAD